MRIEKRARKANDFIRLSAAVTAIALFLSATTCAGFNAEAGINLAYNSSFEECTNAGVADGIMCHTTSDRMLRLLPTMTVADYGVTETDAYHGRFCLQTSPTVFWRTMVYPYPFQLKANRPYTLSVYAKAEKPDSLVRFGAWTGWIDDAFTVGQQWQRIVKTITPPNDTEVTLAGMNVSQGKIWWDALQVEEGDTATEYVPVAPKGMYDVTGKVSSRPATVVPESQLDNDGPGPEYDRYLDQETMRCRFDLCKMDNPQGRILRASITNRKAETCWAQEVQANERNPVLTIPVQTLPHGEYRLQVQIVQEPPLSLPEKSFAFLRLPPPPSGTVVRANRHRRALVIDGQPFVGIGTSAYTRNSPANERVWIEDMKAHGINVLYLWEPGRGYADSPQPAIVPANVGEWLDMAHKHGMKISVFLGMYCDLRKETDRFGYSDSEMLAYLTDIVTRYRSHPALLTWEISDEPDNPGGPTVEHLETIYQRVRELDPYHPVTVNVNFGASKYRRWAPVIDLPSVDCYPLPLRPVSDLAHNVAEMQAAAPFLPLRYWIQSVGDMRESTPRELQSMTYMAAIHGCQQFLFWNYRPMSPDAYQMWTQCSHELRELAHALAATERRVVAVDAENGAIHASLRIADDGTAYCIAVNVLRESITAKLVLPEAGQNVKAEVLFEQRTVPIVDQSIQDAFEPLERHVYKFTSFR